MGTYLITGVAGFIGSRVCESLLLDGHIVIGVDNLNDYYDVRLKDYRLSRLLTKEEWTPRIGEMRSTYSTRLPMRSNEAVLTPCLNGKFSFYSCDIENLMDLDAIFSKFEFDAVLNLAARAGVRYSVENPHIYVRTNVHGVLNVLECQRKYNVKKHVLASTSSLYAGSEAPFTECLPVNTPLSPYAASKKAAEMMAYTYHKLFGIDVTVLRYFTVFGPAGRPDMSPFRFIEAIRSKRPLHLFGDGSQSRDFTYVDDVVAGTIKALKPVGYEAVNLGGGRRPITLRQMIDIIEAEVGEKAEIKTAPFAQGDMTETWADIQKAKDLLGWQPLTSVEDGLRLTIQWHMRHRGWLSDIVI